jgi:phosphatidylglycerophosphate synthase
LTIETALISAPDRANNTIFGRTLLERLMINCERAGVKRFVIQSKGQPEELARAMGSYHGRDCVRVVDSFSELLQPNDGKSPERWLDPSSPCIAFTGNLVLSKLQLNRLLKEHTADLAAIHHTFSTDRDRGGEMTAGSIGQILRREGLRDVESAPTLALLPFALNGRPEDREEAELRLAKSLQEETAQKDSPMARWIDRRISWRISYRLARTAVTPNMVTIANVMLGLGCAWMFAVPDYWTRLLASILFLCSITIDGVDGELARLKMKETDFGGMLDVVTDNIVHVAVFIGLLTGCYRASGSGAYLYLIPILLTGFGLCAYATWRAFKFRGAEAAKWLDTVNRWTGRDFAYLLVILAIFNRLEYFAWGSAFGTYVFAALLVWITGRTASTLETA